MQLRVRCGWFWPGAAAGAAGADSITADAAAFLSCGTVELLLLHVFALACVVQQPTQDSLAGRTGAGAGCVLRLLLECGTWRDACVGCMHVVFLAAGWLVGPCLQGFTPPYLPEGLDICCCAVLLVTCQDECQAAQLPAPQRDTPTQREGRTCQHMRVWACTKPGTAHPTDMLAILEDALPNSLLSSTCLCCP